MPSLIPEILFDIARQLLEEGNQEDVIQFALSGREPYHAMKRVFASVTTLQLYDDHYIVGWGKKCSKQFEFRSDKPHSMELMYCIGPYVTSLHLDNNFQVYQPIIDKIVARKRLETLSVSAYCTPSFLDNFISVFSGTLKTASIPYDNKAPTFCKTLKLRSLTIADLFEHESSFFYFKTPSVEICRAAKEDRSTYYSIKDMFSSLDPINPGFFHVTRLTFHQTYLKMDLNDFNLIMRHFPSLAYLHFNILMNFPACIHCLQVSIALIALEITKFIDQSVKAPSKITCTLHKCNDDMELPDLQSCQVLFDDYLYVEKKVSDFYCFQKVVPSTDDQTTLFEVQIAK